MFDSNEADEDSQFIHFLKVSRHILWRLLSEPFKPLLKNKNITNPKGSMETKYRIWSLIETEGA